MSTVRGIPYLGGTKIVGLIDIAQGQIDYILVKFDWKLDEKFAKICVALLGRVTELCNYISPLYNLFMYII